MRVNSTPKSTPDPFFPVHLCVRHSRSHSLDHENPIVRAVFVGRRV